MGFNENDMDSLLLYAYTQQGGQYNHLQWSVQMGANATDRLSQVVSIHEFFHNELNNTTVYGTLLQGYAFLSRLSHPERRALKRC